MHDAQYAPGTQPHPFAEPTCLELPGLLRVLEFGRLSPARQTIAMKGIMILRRPSSDKARRLFDDDSSKMRTLTVAGNDGKK